jgi:GYF domain 2
MRLNGGINQFMDINYKMIGADGQQYGPVTMEQIKDWIREGRVTAATQVLRSDVNSWLPAVQYTELGLAQVPPMPAPGAPAPLSAGNPAAVIERANLARRVRSGAGWFIWVGVFSLVNSIVLMTGNSWRFIVGLGITDVIAYFSSRLESAGMAVGFVLDLLVLAVFVVFGIFARKGHSWSFIAGMVCYTADGCLFFLLGMPMASILFHGIVLVFMFMGLQANIRLKALQRGAVA